MTHYPLGTSDAELDRLRFQHEVWGGKTRAFLDRIGVKPGLRVLDLGCGPGFVTFELAERVGAGGEVVALDESPRWIEHVEGEIRRLGVSNVRAVRSRIQEADFETESFDLVFARWVLSFLPSPGDVVARLSRCLAVGGAFAFQDYNHEGVSLFPESEGFRAIVRATRAMYAQSGGDTWVAGRTGAIFRKAGLETESVVPNVICGGPDSPAFRWAGLFFPHFSVAMEQKGLLTAAERRQFLAEWAAREQDPDALFFSPIVVDAIGRKRPRADRSKSKDPARTS
ncbi:MAG: class I SAM-dependent methyltransferase [Planctomycetota bacterium]